MSCPWIRYVDNVELLGGVIFDFDVNTAYRSVFRKLDEVVAEMEELRG